MRHGSLFFPFILSLSFLTHRFTILTNQSAAFSRNPSLYFGSATLKNTITFITRRIPNPILATLSGINIDIRNYMFGSILAMNQSDVYISIILSVIVGMYHFFMPLLGLFFGNIITNYFIFDVNIVVFDIINNNVPVPAATNCCEPVLEIELKSIFTLLSVILK